MHKSIDYNGLGITKRGGGGGDLQKIKEKRDMTQIKNTIKEVIPEVSIDKMKQIGFLHNGK